VLAGAQHRHRCLVVGATGEVVAADALDRHDLPAPQRNDGRRQRRLTNGSGLRARPVQQCQRRSATRTGVGLGMEAPVGRVLIFGAAGIAHGKAGHRRQRAVVGNAANDGETRPAVGAVDERVAETTVGRIVQLAQAVVAHRRVGRHRRVRHPTGRTRTDREARLAGDDALGPLHFLDDRQWRRLAGQAGTERLHRVPGTLDFGDHAVRIGVDEPAQPQLAGQPVDVGAKAHALNGAADANARPHQALPHRRLKAHPASARSA
jgi:hypothetical protein